MATQAELMQQIPEELRAKVQKMIDQQVDKQVEIQVREKSDQLQKQIEQVQNELQSTRKSIKEAAQAPATPAKKTFGLKQPTATSSNVNSTPKRPGATSRLQTGLKSRPLGGLGNDAETDAQKDLLKTPRQTANGKTVGLKRPSTAIGAKTGSAADQTPVKSRIGGLRPPSAIQSNLTSKLGSKLVDKVQSSNLKATPSKRIISNIPAGPKSVEKDEVDEIYKNEDPIGTSIDIRKKGGSLSTVVADKNAKVGKFFFTFKTKGPEVQISQQATKAAQIMAGAKVDATGNVIEEEKPKPDPIDKSIAVRTKGGSPITNVVVDKTKKEAEAFKLKVKGGQPKIAAARQDPSLASELTADKAAK